ncbi:MAG: undecaprenyl/decaprenyl-phosphate alpha-N-acetylglucosaminyl 1-phosphate transferase [Bacteroidetes bacterium]|nr:MAG: undecaprenyl/decaprenyl-phosphate alpha-N-acetylglucosaminyl 1-phosphate transferase [Bacteroidota bacterium]
MVEILMSLALAFGITFYAIPSIIHVSVEKRLFDLPDDRKIHKAPIPSLGGLGIFAGFITSFLLTVTFTENWMSLQYLVAALLVMFFVGIKDDLLNITALKKFLGQMLAAGILIFKGGFVITSMDGILGIYQLPSVAAYSLTFITIIVIINAFNLIDGVDGLAGSLGILSCGAFSIFFAINGQYHFALIGTSMVGALSAFLIFNLRPARIFMGDTGSLIIGLINAVLVIQFINYAPTAPVFKVGAAPAVGFAIMFVPLFDTLRVFSMRMLHGESPFTPDRNHIHHLLLRLGFNHTQVTGSLVLANLIFPLAAFFTQGLGSNWLLIGLVSVGSLGVFGVANVYARRRVVLADGEIAPNKLTKTKIKFVSYVSKDATNPN